MSVFSNTLLERRKLFPNAPTQQDSIEDIIKWWSKTKHFGLIPDVFLYPDCLENENILYLTCTNKDVIKLLNWVNINIVKQLAIDNFKTRDVKIRIATGMLNKISIDPIVQNEIWNNFVKNVLDTACDINSNLPF